MKLHHGQLKGSTSQPLLQVGVDSKMEVNSWDSSLTGEQNYGGGG